jgi:hypothetical protein
VLITELLGPDPKTSRHDQSFAASLEDPERGREGQYDSAVHTGPVVETCPNCGAPLDLDDVGACRWCRARIRTGQAGGSGSDALDEDRDNLVPEDVDRCALSSVFLSAALSATWMLGTEPVVQEYMHREPRLIPQIRALSTAVSAAGGRVYDADLVGNRYDGSFEMYTPGEIWIFDLAFDVIALLRARDGLSRQTLTVVAGSMRWTDDLARRSAWKKAIKAAGEGPAAWHELRVRVPHR